mgnify:CR=1 FL=1
MNTSESRPRARAAVSGLQAAHEALELLAAATRAAMRAETMLELASGPGPEAYEDAPASVLH